VFDFAVIDQPVAGASAARLASIPGHAEEDEFAAIATSNRLRWGTIRRGSAQYDFLK
jgi:hypothetical protein